MIEKIKQLEKTAKLLEPNLNQKEEWIEQTKNYTSDYYKSLSQRNAFDNPLFQELKEDTFLIDGKTSSYDSLLQDIDRELDSCGINPASPYDFGYIPGGGLFPGALGDFLVAVTNRYSGISFASPGHVKMENELIRWMCKIIGFPSTALGNLTSGGSIANLIALTTAREARKIKARNFHEMVFYLSNQTHHAAQKSIRIAGMQESITRYIPVDGKFRMNTQMLQQQIELDKQAGLIPFFIFASAGTTDTGATDRLDLVADICKMENIWMHVDAAYGGFFILVEELASKFIGIERADSVTIDPHKGLFLPYGLGAVLIKNTKAQMDAHVYQANYMQDVGTLDEEISPAYLSPELTKHARGLRMWIPLKLFGIAPFKAALEEKVLLCKYFYIKIQALGFEVGPEPDLSISIFRYVPKDKDANDFNEQLIKKIQKEGRIFLSTTTLNNTYWIRMAIVCFRSHLKEVDLCLQILETTVKALLLNKKD